MGIPDVRLVPKNSVGVNALNWGSKLPNSNGVVSYIGAESGTYATPWMGSPFGFTGPCTDGSWVLTIIGRGCWNFRTAGLLRRLEKSCPAEATVGTKAEMKAGKKLITLEVNTAIAVKGLGGIR